MGTHALVVFAQETQAVFSFFWNFIWSLKRKKFADYLSLLASLSDSRRVRMSPSRTGPLTFLMIWRFCSPKNSTRTWVHCPWDPVRPRILMTRAKVTDLSMLVVLQVKFERWKSGFNADTTSKDGLHGLHVFQETWNILTRSPSIEGETNSLLSRLCITR